MSDIYPASLENIVLSRETPIVIHQQPQLPPRPQEPAIKSWITKLLIACFVVLALEIALAIVLVVLAVLGYLGREKVEVVDIVQQPTATATPTAHVIRNLTGRVEERVVPLVLLSGSGKVIDRAGIIACELVLAWGLVVLFDKFENREREGHENGERERGRSRERRKCSSERDTDRNTFHYANATSGA
jgi:hypothetical protein